MKWTKVSDKLPPYRKSVIICTNFENQQFGALVDDELWDTPYMLRKGEFVTHWMFKPKSPKEYQR